METTTIYVATDKTQQFEDTGHCTIAYVGTEQQIISNILEDDGDLIDYVFYELDQSNKYEIKQSLVKIEV